jgi:hypothetical protein
VFLCQIYDQNANLPPSDLHPVHRLAGKVWRGILVEANLTFTGLLRPGGGMGDFLCIILKTLHFWIMPRHRGLEGTTLFPKKHKVESPFLNQFCELVEVSLQLITTRELHRHYLSYIQTLDLDLKLRTLGESYRRFALCFASRARQNGWQYTSHNSRGYFLKVQRVHRAKSSISSESMQGQLTNYLGTPWDMRNLYFRRTFISRTKGYGAIATQDITKGTPICEYFGQHISKAEAERREKEYAQKNMCSTMFQIDGSHFFDGYKDGCGQNLSIEKNPGAWVNHSKDANSKMFRLTGNDGQTKLILVSIAHIPQGHEVTYDYGDQRKGLESWIY